MDNWTQSEAAKARGVCHTKEECEAMYRALTPEKKQPALELLRKELAPARADIVSDMERDGEHWIAGNHHGWGTSVRNFLRQSGYGEEYFGVHNLDDIYVALIEEAVGETGHE